MFPFVLTPWPLDKVDGIAFNVFAQVYCMVYSSMISRLDANDWAWSNRSSAFPPLPSFLFATEATMLRQRTIDELAGR